jgi:nitrogen-specific signal transduction histidine kinase
MLIPSATSRRPPDCRRHEAKLGLAIAREIISEHHGEIEYVASSRKGAEFRLILPVTKATAQAPRRNEVTKNAA